MIKKEQSEIMKAWTSADVPLVSIRCMTYNHEKYIARALESFLEQETSFPFEIVVHDDASSDSTAAIIRKYEQRYPGIVKPIYEFENQYSKHDGSLTRAINAKLRGRYIALCEGDDYWCDSRKLQMAVDLLENDESYSACAHNTMLVSAMSLRRKKIKMYSGEKDLNIENVMYDDDYHTSSLVCRREFWFNRPSFCFEMPGVGDYPLKIFLALSGKIKRFGDVMSVYYFGNPNSWTRKNHDDVDKKLQTYVNAIKMIESANRWSDFKYDHVLKIGKYRFFYRAFLNLGKFEMVKDPVFKDFWKMESLKNKIKFYFEYFRIGCKMKNRAIWLEKIQKLYEDNL